MRALNLGIVAHVDAGKTTLTERLLYAAGAIDQVGSVDAGTTTTDSLDLERQRGITIKAAVVSFVVDEVTVNLIDTPGHPDFIAEVERALGVLDGAVLVISAVEGVQPQTRVLMRTLQRLKVPTVFFVNKIDRVGARSDGLLAEITDRLTPACVPVGSVRGLGTRAAEFAQWGEADTAFREKLVETLAERDDSMLRDYVDDNEPPTYDRLWDELGAQARRGVVHPVFFGSALTGAGVEELKRGVVDLLTPDERDADGDLSGLVFKVDRSVGEKVAYAAIFSGTLRERRPAQIGSRGGRRRAKVVGIEVFHSATTMHRDHLSAGEIGRLKGLTDARVGDVIGPGPERLVQGEFPPPALEAVVVARHPSDGAALRSVIRQLAEQDPLVNLREDPIRQEISVSLYGEVQKEVIQATLAAEFGLEVAFRETTTIYIERPAGSGSHVELLQSVTHPFSATVGLRIDPAPPGSGVKFRLATDPNLLPLYIYKTANRFTEAMTRYITTALEEGRYGWQVTDCLVAMTDCGYYIGDGPGKPAGGTPRTTAAHFRHLTPLVVAGALDRARTVVCEPMLRARIETPTEAVGSVLAEIAALGGIVEDQTAGATLTVIRAQLPAARTQALRRQLPGLTSGEGVIETSFAGYRPLRGRPPNRERTTPDPLKRREYLKEVTGRFAQ